MHPDVTPAQPRERRRARHQAEGARSRRRSSAPTITTLVLNGTTIGGLARDTSYKLARRGLPHGAAAADDAGRRADATDYASSYVYFDAVQPNAKEAAQQLKVAMGPHTSLAPLPPEIAPYAQQAGNPLDGRRRRHRVQRRARQSGRRTSSPAPPRQPPNVRTAPEVTLGPLEACKAKVRFRIMVAARARARARTSRTHEPVRVFKPAPHTRELALTFVHGAGNVYWQVIETNWNGRADPPPPDRHSTTLKAAASTDLYTTGGHIHMVVLYKGGASYWVVNTLRDELSNETMLAIAKGLQPLGQVT